ncbi:MAG TPA: EpsI family protein [Bryobacteraceae bacterium]|nr:EpsI family protein [Bryobacteraceae bacterium]
MPDFLKSRAAKILTLALVAQATLFYTLSHGEAVLMVRPLSDVPQQLGSWHMVSEGVVEPEIRSVLNADDYLTRDYASPTSRLPVNLFVEYFRTQRTGQTPHTPKNCLPGSGWLQVSSGTIPVSVQGKAEPIQVNRYIVARGDNRDIVMYWYQSHGQVIASEYKAKIYTVMDAIRYNRTDTAMIRVVVPIAGSEEEATKAGVNFIQATFPVLASLLPS